LPLHSICEEHAISDLLTESQIHATTRRNAKVLICGFGIGIAAIFVSFEITGLFRADIIAFTRRHFGETAAEVWFLPWILLALAVFLIPSLLAARNVDSYAVTCPLCSAALTHSLGQVVVTRCCSECGKRIIEGGRERRVAVWDRKQRIETRRLARYGVWIFHGMTIFTLTWPFIDPATWEQNPHMPFACALLATGTSGWAWIRTLHRQYLPSLFAAIILLIIGSFALWRSIYSV